MTDFKGWLFGVYTGDFSEIYELYYAVQDCVKRESFSCTERVTSKGKQYIVECDYIEESLILASPKARSYFLDYLEETYAKDLGIEGEYGFRYNLDKDD